MPSRTIRSPAQFDQLGRVLSQLSYPFTVSWKAGEDRSLSQNALQFKWAGEAAAQLGDRTADLIQRQWKLDHGVPILRSENDDFREFSELALRRLTYEQRLNAMRYVPVTSIMTVPQMTAFLDAVYRQCVEQGIALTVPKERT